MALIKGKQIASLDATKVNETTEKQFISATEKTTYAGKQDALGFTPLDAVKVGAANGVAALDADGKVTANVDASKIVGTIDIAQIPQAALERLTKVADQAARFALTASNVQLGDTVQQLDTLAMYVVTDVANLASEAGYTPYVASANWAAITDKPTSTASAIDAAVTASASISVRKELLITVTANQTAINTGIKTDGSGTYNAVNSDISLSVNGFDQVQGAGKDYTVAVAANEIVVTWLNRSFVLEADDEVVIGYNAKV